MGLIHESKAYGFYIRESANDGSDFSNPDADYRIVFLGEDGEWHSRDSAGNIAGFAGSGIASTIVNAKGDLIVASADNTPAILTAGANGKVPTYASGETTGVLPKYPPGYILDYVEITSPVTVNGTSEGAATTVITGTSQAYTTDPIWVEFYCPDLQDSGAGFCIVHLWDGGTVLGRLGIFAGATGERWPGGTMKVKLTPTAATHQYIIKGQVDASSSTIGAGNKGSAAYMPAFLAVTVA